MLSRLEIDEFSVRRKPAGLADWSPDGHAEGTFVPGHGWGGPAEGPPRIHGPQGAAYGATIIALRSIESLMPSPAVNMRFLASTAEPSTS